MSITEAIKNLEVALGELKAALQAEGLSEEKEAVPGENVSNQAEVSYEEIARVNAQFDVRF